MLSRRVYADYPIIYGDMHLAHFERRAMSCGILKRCPHGAGAVVAWRDYEMADNARQK